MNFQRTIAKHLAQNRDEQNSEKDSRSGVKQNAAAVDDRGSGICVQIDGGKNKQEKKWKPPASHSPFILKHKFSHSPIPRKYERGRNSLQYPTASSRGCSRGVVKIVKSGSAGTLLGAFI